MIKDKKHQLKDWSFYNFNDLLITQSHEYKYKVGTQDWVDLKPHA